MNDKERREQQRIQEHLRKEKERIDNNNKSIRKRQEDEMIRSKKKQSDEAWRSHYQDKDNEDGCFTAETLISTPNGQKRIVDLSKGELVYSLGKNGVEVSAIKKVSSYPNVRILEIKVNGKIVQTTKDHPFLTDKGWKKGKDIKVDDMLLNEFGDKAKVEEVGITDNYLTTYNLIVHSNYNFIAEGFVVNSFCRFFIIRGFFFQLLDFIKFNLMSSRSKEVLQSV